MDENMLSSNALQLENNDISENTADNVSEYVKRVRKESIADIMAMQGIVCIITAIAFVVLNIVQPNLAADIFSLYSEKTSGSDGLTDIIHAVVDFLRSTPNV